MIAGRSLRLVRLVLVALLGLGALVGPSHVAASAKAKPKTAPPIFVALHEVDPTILHDIRYTTQHNFIGRRIHGYKDPLCILTRPAAEALERAQDAVLALGYSLKVYDCYRPQTAVDDFVRWAERLRDDRMKAEFYPDVDKSRLFADGYIAARSGHSRGSTVDLTLVELPAAPQPRWRPSMGLVPCYAPYEERFPDNTVDMGTGFDCFDPLSATLDPRIQGQARENRLLLKSTLEAVGFTNYAEEWWHYTLADEPFPNRYFDFPVSRRALR
jgi:D-alanyl-D-alanine dipeptidase